MRCYIHIITSVHTFFRLWKKFRTWSFKRITTVDRLQRASHPVPAAVNGTLGALFTRPADCPLRLGKTGYLPPVPQICASPPASDPNCRSRPPLLPLWCISGGRSTATTTTGADGDSARTDHPHRFSGGRRSSCKSRRRTRSSSPPVLDLPLLRHHLQQVLLDSPLSISSPASMAPPLLPMHRGTSRVPFVLSLCSYACCCWWWNSSTNCKTARIVPAPFSIPCHYLVSFMTSYGVVSYAYWFWVWINLVGIACFMTS